MTGTTMGQRIGERRKLLGISQEALGEKMGVSRQAISKWESDGAVPEVDKLIAMSRLFGVSVGWLLGTEDICGEETPKPSLPQPQSPRRNWPVLALGVVCVILTAAVLCLWHSLEQLRDRVDHDIAVLKQENSRLEDRVYTLRTEMQTQMTSAEDEMFSQVYCSVEAEDDGKQALVYVTLVPKKWQQGDHVEITAVLGGKKVEQQSCIWDGTAYSGVLVLPAENGYEYYCTVIHADGSREQQGVGMEEVENLARLLQVGCSAGTDAYTIAQLEGTLDLYHTYISLAMPACLDGPEYDSVSWEKVAFALYKNGQEVDRAAPAGLMNPGDNSKTFHASVENLRLHFGGMEKGDCLELWLEAALSNGMTGKCCVDGWMLDEEGLTKLVMVDEE